MARVTRWKVGQVLGRPRAEWFESWVTWGLLPPADSDGLWDEGVLERANHARHLGEIARPLAPRALLLHRDGFHVTTPARKNAVAYVLGHMSRPRHAMAQVLWELRALGSQFAAPIGRQRVLAGTELPPSRWPEIPAAASDSIFDKWYQWADLVVDQLPVVGAAKGVPFRDPIAYPDRLALALITELLEEPYVRNRVGLPPKAPRYALSIQE